MVNGQEILKAFGFQQSQRIANTRGIRAFSTPQHQRNRDIRSRAEALGLPTEQVNQQIREAQQTEQLRGTQVGRGRSGRTLSRQINQGTSFEDIEAQLTRQENTLQFNIAPDVVQNLRDRGAFEPDQPLNKTEALFNRLSTSPSAVTGPVSRLVATAMITANDQVVLEGTARLADTLGLNPDVWSAPIREGKIGEITTDSPIFGNDFVDGAIFESLGFNRGGDFEDVGRVGSIQDRIDNEGEGAVALDTAFGLLDITPGNLLGLGFAGAIRRVPGIAGDAEKFRFIPTPQKLSDPIYKRRRDAELKNLARAGDDATIRDILVRGGIEDIVEPHRVDIMTNHIKRIDDPDTIRRYINDVIKERAHVTKASQLDRNKLYQRNLAEMVGSPFRTNIDEANPLYAGLQKSNLDSKALQEARVPTTLRPMVSSVGSTFKSRGELLDYVDKNGFDAIRRFFGNHRLYMHSRSRPNIIAASVDEDQRAVEMAEITKILLNQPREISKNIRRLRREGVDETNYVRRVVLEGKLGLSDRQLNDLQRRYEKVQQLANSRNQRLAEAQRGDQSLQRNYENHVNDLGETDEARANALWDMVEEAQQLQNAIPDPVGVGRNFFLKNKRIQSGLENLNISSEARKNTTELFQNRLIGLSNEMYDAMKANGMDVLPDQMNPYIQAKAIRAIVAAEAENTRSFADEIGNDLKELLGSYNNNSANQALAGREGVEATAETTQRTATQTEPAVREIEEVDVDNFKLSAQQYDAIDRSAQVEQIQEGALRGRGRGFVDISNTDIGRLLPENSPFLRMSRNLWEEIVNDGVVPRELITNDILDNLAIKVGDEEFFGLDVFRDLLKIDDPAEYILRQIDERSLSAEDVIHHIGDDVFEGTAEVTARSRIGRRDPTRVGDEIDVTSRQEVEVYDLNSFVERLIEDGVPAGTRTTTETTQTARAAVQATGTQQSRPSRITGRELLDDYNNYRVARRSPEYNARYGEDASSLTDEQAQQVIDGIDEKYGAGFFDNIAAKHSEFDRETLAIQRDAGLISNEDYIDILAAGDNYVPLQREFDQNENFLRGQFGDRYRLTPTVRTARGSKRKVVDILGASEQNRAIAIAAREANEVGARLQNVFDTGALDDVIEPVSARGDNTYSFLVNGRERFYEVKEPQLQRALTSLLPHEVNTVVSAVGKFTRMMSLNFTAANPGFYLANYSRDWIDMISSINGDIGFKAALNAAQRSFPILGTSSRALLPQRLHRALLVPQKVSNQAQIFKATGGEIGGVVTNLVRENESIISRHMDNVLKRKIGRLDQRAWRTVWDELGRAFLGVSGFIENTNRFSGWRAAVANNATVDQAREASHFVTINFLERGRGIAGTRPTFTVKGRQIPIIPFTQNNKIPEGFRGIGSSYAFLNAGVQGVNRLSRTAFTPKGLASMLLISTSLAYAEFKTNQHKQGRKEGLSWYDEIETTQPYRAQRYFMFSRGEDDYATIPMSYNAAPFMQFGRTLVNMIEGDATDKETLDRFVDIPFMTAGLLNPMNEGTLLHKFSPTVVQPFISTLINEDWHGGMVSPKGVGILSRPEDTVFKSQVANNRTEWQLAKLLSRANNSLGESFFDTRLLNTPGKASVFLNNFGGGVLDTAAGLVDTIRQNAGILPGISGEEIINSDTVQTNPALIDNVLLRAFSFKRPSLIRIERGLINERFENDARPLLERIREGQSEGNDDKIAEGLDGLIDIRQDLIGEGLVDEGGIDPGNFMGALLRENGAADLQGIFTRKVANVRAPRMEYEVDGTVKEVPSFYDWYLYLRLSGYSEDKKATRQYAAELTERYNAIAREANGINNAPGE